MIFGWWCCSESPKAAGWPLQNLRSSDQVSIAVLESETTTKDLPVSCCSNVSTAAFDAVEVSPESAMTREPAFTARKSPSMPISFPGALGIKTQISAEIGSRGGSTQAVLQLSHIDGRESTPGPSIVFNAAG